MKKNGGKKSRGTIPLTRLPNRLLGKFIFYRRERRKSLSFKIKANNKHKTELTCGANRGGPMQFYSIPPEYCRHMIRLWQCGLKKSCGYVVATFRIRLAYFYKS
jgi:hypothetical protein